MEKPTINYAVAYQKFRAELTNDIMRLQQTIPLPTYMVEGILGSLLADIRSAAITENVMEEIDYKDSLEKYYEEREQKLNDEIQKLKATEG